jgi:DNA-directed RNA polymerase specialized sigma subunit
VSTASKTIDTDRNARLLRKVHSRQPLTQYETAEFVGCTRSYIQQLEQQALTKIRAELGDDTIRVMLGGAA